MPPKYLMRSINKNIVWETATQFVYFCALVISAVMQADGEEIGKYTLSRLPLTDLLDQSSIVNMLLDRHGQLWMRTQTGLHRFDGINIRALYVDTLSSGGEVWPRIRIVEDSSGFVWFASLDNGLLRFDRRRRQMVKFLPKAGPELPAQPTISSLFHDNERTLWVGYQDGNVIRIDTIDLSVIEGPDTKKYLARGELIVGFVSHHEGGVWVAGSEGSILRCWPGEKSCIYTQLSELLEGYAGSRIQSLSTLGDGSLLLGTNDKGIVQVNAAELIAKSIVYEGSIVEYALTRSVSAIRTSASGDIWIGTDHGLVRVSKDQHIVHYNSGNSILADDQIYSLEIDANDNLLVGTYSGLYSFKKSEIVSFGPTSGLSNTKVTSFTQTDSSRLVIGTFGQMHELNLRLGTLTPLNGYFGNKFPSDPRVTSLFSSQGKLWVGHYKTGLKKIDIQSGHSQTITLSAGAAQSISDILRIDEETIAVTTYGSGAALLGNEGNELHHFYNSEEAPAQITSNSVFCAALARQELLLLGSVSGLSILTHSHNAEGYAEPASLYMRDTDVYSIVISSDGGAWMGTREMGLYHWKPEDIDSGKPIFSRVSTSPELPSNTIYAIEEDSIGMLWLSTNNGLVRLDPKRLSINVFDQSDGLPDNEFNIGASFKDDKGYLYFGGNKGFVRFDPTKIIPDRTPPPVRLVDLAISGKKVSYDPAYTDISEIVLKASDHSVDFEFSTMDIISPGRSQYKYKLENFDPDWVDIGTRHSATFTSLPSGEYTLRVIGANSDGIWNYDGIALPVKVLPAPWLTWWAFTLYGIVVLGLLLFFKRFYDTRLLKEQATQRARMMSTTATRAMDELQDQLKVERRLVGSTREHASATIAIIEELLGMEEEEYRDRLPEDLLPRTRQQLRCLQALEENIFFHRDEIKIEFRSVVDEIFEAVMNNAPELDCEIVLANDSTESVIPAQVATFLAVIIHEALLNSVTHAFEESRGVQCIVVSLRENNRKKSWNLEISDTGCGLPASIDPARPATMGMELISRFVQKLGATIKVSRENGTSFHLIIPYPDGFYPI